MQKAHGHGIDAFRGERARRCCHAVPVEFLVDRARRQHALGDLPGEVPRHQRTMAMKEKIVRLRTVTATNNVNVTGSAGDDQPSLGPGAFNERVDGDRRTVDEFIDGAGGQAALLQAIDDALHEIGRRGEALGVDEAPGAIVKSNQIGKGAADIDGNGNHAAASRLRG